MNAKNAYYEYEDLESHNSESLVKKHMKRNYKSFLI